MSEYLNLQSISGYCLESSIWKMLIDITSAFRQNESKKVDAKTIYIDDDKFCVSDSADKCSEKESIWYIGAAICFMSSGHSIFGGKGKEYQVKHPNVQLPVLCREHEALTPLVQKCLNADAEKRISLNELYRDATEGYNACLKREQTRKIIAISTQSAEKDMTANDLWPEEMENTTKTEY